MGSQPAEMAAAEGQLCLSVCLSCRSTGRPAAAAGPRLLLSPLRGTGRVCLDSVICRLYVPSAATAVNQGGGGGLLPPPCCAGVCSAGREEDGGAGREQLRTHLTRGKQPPLIPGPGSHGERWIPSVGDLEASFRP